MPRGRGNRIAVGLLLLVGVNGCHAIESRAVDESVVVLEVDGEPTCLATILEHGSDAGVSSSWALTAKHCVMLPGEDTSIGTERVQLRGPLLPVRVDEVIVLGESYASVADLEDDLALLRLRERPSGGIDVGALHEPLRVAVFQEAGEVTWIEAPVRRIDDSHVYSDPVTCGGDSGGPLIATDRSIVGVASWSTDERCGHGSSVFVRIEPHRAWIDSTTSLR